MPKSHRCPSEILALGERILSECSDYWDRGIQPREPGGTIDRALFSGDWAEDLDPRETWLVLARTNYEVTRLAKRLDSAGIPWLPTRKDRRNQWDAPVRNEAIKALLNLQSGAPIDGAEWRSIIKTLPNMADGQLLRVRGTLTRFEKMARDEAQEKHPWVRLDEIGELGATGVLREMIANGKWRGLVEGVDQYAEPIERWGTEVVDTPRVRVGTVHSAKGLEADNVAMLTTISQPVYNAAQTQEGLDEELRVRYVAATRAKKRLVVLGEPKAKYKWRIPE